MANFLELLSSFEKTQNTIQGVFGWQQKIGQHLADTAVAIPTQITQIIGSLKQQPSTSTTPNDKPGVFDWAQQIGQLGESFVDIVVNTKDKAVGNDHAPIIPTDSDKNTTEDASSLQPTRSSKISSVSSKKRKDDSEFVRVFSVKYGRRLRDLKIRKNSLFSLGSKLKEIRKKLKVARYTVVANEKLRRIHERNLMHSVDQPAMTASNQYVIKTDEQVVTAQRYTNALLKREQLLIRQIKQKRFEKMGLLRSHLG